MVRPKAFDPDSALDHAMKTFWSKGFMATTVQDLVESTGLGRGSLYNAFTSKEQLFRDALRRYDSVWTARQEQVLVGPGSLRDRVSALLMTVVDEETTQGPPRGCLAVNTALELADQDPAVRELVREVFLRMENALHEAISVAQATGEVTADDDARALALYVLNSMYGLRVLGKTTSRESLVGVVEMVLRAL
ncbi:TetR/AcrR family transcriptional regulator [Saccharothrix texasensis]|uniref:TetR family transcriptional regulator n=1 Tax=Saccharothrix texasensis TaxID=103734 RepID=A0A3N1GXF9_9PSEU|nr:TetR/AcrR family transcriptional regulator [Saccharothrix texasensis]ROP34950.1 TetR family transcriptional regulator [Saccharothrix texasensis]